MIRWIARGAIPALDLLAGGESLSPPRLGSLPWFEGHVSGGHDHAGRTDGTAADRAAMIAA
jgi:hypothetical protein